MKKSVRFSARTLCYAAVFVALEIVLNRFLSINTHGWKIGFSFVPVALCAILFGPLWAGGVNALADFMGAMLFPIGTYHPGFTVVAFITGMVYGLFLYQGGGADRLTHAPRRDAEPAAAWTARLLGFLRILAPTLINCLIFGLLINTVWVSQLYGSRTYGGWFLYRLAEYAILIPLHLVVLPLLPHLRLAMFKARLIDRA